MRLNNIVIAAHDYESMRDFYKALTDWPVFFENDKCCFLGRGKPYVVVHRVGPETEVNAPTSTMCLDFEVIDLDAEVVRLQQFGLAPVMKGEMATLRDPANNLIELVPSE